MRAYQATREKIGELIAQGFRFYALPKNGARRILARDWIPETQPEYIPEYSYTYWEKYIIHAVNHARGLEFKITQARAQAQKAGN
jgi:hypothetical protein